MRFELGKGKGKGKGKKGGEKKSNPRENSEYSRPPTGQKDESQEERKGNRPKERGEGNNRAAHSVSSGKGKKGKNS